jgi:hypothetical protein
MRKNAQKNAQKMRKNVKKMRGVFVWIQIFRNGGGLFFGHFQPLLAGFMPLWAIFDHFCPFWNIIGHFQPFLVTFAPFWGKLFFALAILGHISTIFAHSAGNGLKLDKTVRKA